MRRGQILVELALTLPFIMFLILGATEVGFLLIAKADQDHRTIVVAEWAASHPGNSSWNSVAEHELKGCDVEMSTPEHDLLEVRATCQYHPIVLVMWNGLPISTRAQAALRPPPDSPTTTPAASPSS